MPTLHFVLRTALVWYIKNASQNTEHSEEQTKPYD